MGQVLMQAPIRDLVYPLIVALLGLARTDKT